MRKKESVLQDKCIDWVQSNYWGKLLVVDIHGGGYSNKGFPDLIVFGNSKAIAVELKSGSGYQVQPDQLVWRNRFMRVGTPHYVLRDLDSFKQTLRKEFPNETQE